MSSETNVKQACKEAIPYDWPVLQTSLAWPSRGGPKNKINKGCLPVLLLAVQRAS